MRGCTLVWLQTNRGWLTFVIIIKLNTVICCLTLQKLETLQKILNKNIQHLVMLQYICSNCSVLSCHSYVISIVNILVVPNTKSLRTSRYGILNYRFSLTRHNFFWTIIARAVVSKASLIYKVLQLTLRK